MRPFFPEGGLWVVLAVNASIVIAGTVLVAAIIAIAIKGYRALKNRDNSN